MLRVGLTGGIGSGKSTVAGRLGRHGAVVIDADRIAREVVKPGAEGLRAVIAEFGVQVRAADGSLNRPALAATVFGDPAARARLDALLHPLIRARSAELVAAAAPDAVVVQDVPLLVETGMAPSFPLVVVVHAEAELRVRRVVEHRGMTEQDARARIAAQATDEQRRAAADVWLDNSGDLDRTLADVDRLWAQRLVTFEENLRHGRRAPRPAPALTDPDPGWPEQAERVIAKVARVAGDRALRLDHIGSTSVPGLPAKDVLDLQVVVDDLTVAGVLGDDLAEAGLVRLDGTWWDNGPDGRRWDKVIAVNADPGRAVNCHLRPVGSPAWRDVLLLRDLLRADPRWTAEYADLKRGLTTRSWHSVDEYADAKTPFVRRALAEARRWAERTGRQPDRAGR